MGIFSLLGAKSLNDILGEVEKIVRVVATTTLAVCGMLVVVFAIYVGFRLAKAEDDGKRKDAKNQLIYSIIGIVGIAGVVGLMNFVIPNLTKVPVDVATGSQIDNAASHVMNSISQIINTLLSIMSALATVFAVYVGWQLMKAEDDGKRKQAKTQLMYTVIGVVGIVLIQTLATAILGGIIKNNNSVGSANVNK